MSAVPGSVTATSTITTRIAVDEAVIGLPLGVLCLRWIIRLNRRYQDDQIAGVLADPAQIVARWRIGADELILAERGLIVGRAYYAFAAADQRLPRGLRWPAGRCGWSDAGP